MSTAEDPSSTVASLQAKLGEIHKERQALEKKLGGGLGSSARGPRRPPGGHEHGDGFGVASRGNAFGAEGRPRAGQRDGELSARVGEKRGRLASAVTVPGEEGKEGEEEGGGEEGEGDDGEGRGGGRAQKLARGEGNTQRRVGRSSVVVLPEADAAPRAALRTRRSEVYEATELPEAEKGEVKEIYKTEEVQKRDRRMFGALMGHLGAAQARLRADTGASGILKKQREVLTNVSEKDREMAEKRRAQKAEEQAAARRGEGKERAWLEVRQKTVEKELDYVRYRDYWRAFSGFILTDTEPRLFYVPARMTEALEKLVEKTRGEMEAKVGRKEEEKDESVRELERAFREKWGQVEKVGEERAGREVDGSGGLGGEGEGEGEREGAGEGPAEGGVEGTAPAASSSTDEEREEERGRNGEEAEEEREGVAEANEGTA